MNTGYKLKLDDHREICGHHDTDAGGVHFVILNGKCKTEIKLSFEAVCAMSKIGEKLYREAMQKEAEQ
jgi:hypothetical protein